MRWPNRNAHRMGRHVRPPASRGLESHRIIGPIALRRTMAIHTLDTARLNHFLHHPHRHLTHRQEAGGRGRRESAARPVLRRRQAWSVGQINHAHARYGAREAKMGRGAAGGGLGSAPSRALAIATAAGLGVTTAAALWAAARYASYRRNIRRVRPLGIWDDDETHTRACTHMYVPTHTHPSHRPRGCRRCTSSSRTFPSSRPWSPGPAAATPATSTGRHVIIMVFIRQFVSMEFG